VEALAGASACSKSGWIEISELDGFLAEGAVSILAAEPLILLTRPRHGEQAAVAFHLKSRTRCNFASKALVETPLRLCAQQRVKVCFFMPTEISIPDAEDLKSRVRELRRFL
jgi:hypothetical protein